MQSPSGTLIHAAASSEPASSIPELDFGGSGTPVHFLHANGYPPACYSPLLTRLATQFHVFGMLQRPLWPGSDPMSVHDWRPLTQDLRTFLNTKARASLIGIGHSLGAMVTLRAAQQEPALFRAVVLIDPVLFPTGRIVQLRIMRALGMTTSLNKHIQTALRRRRHFDDLEQLFAGYRRRELFQYFPDEELRALIGGLTRPSADGGFELVYSPEWEARIYETGIWNDSDIWKRLRSLRVPTLIIRGAESDTFGARTAEIVRKQNPLVQTVAVPQATHLVPLERPDEVADATRKFIGKLQRS